MSINHSLTHTFTLIAAGAATNGAAAAPRYAPASTARPHTSGAPFLHPPHHLVPSTLPTAATPCPPGWQTALDVCRATGSSYECVPIDKTSREYRVLESWIAATVSSTATSYPQISGIQRILNPNLWEAFENTRRAMLRTQSGHLGLLQELGVNRNAAQAQAMHSSTTLPPYHDNMVLLFHCTRGNISSVFEEGLDHRLGLGGLLGKGTYFADCPDKSMAYDGHRTLLVYAVLLGDCRWFPATNGSLTREPRKELDHRRRPGDVAFDSIVGRPASHNEYVVYKQDRCVPLYAVSYTAVNGKTSV